MKWIILCFVLCTTLVKAQNEYNKTDKNGWKQGVWKKEVNGVIVYEGTFKNNTPIGTFKRYKEGKIHSIQDFKEGDSISSISIYDPAGLLVSSGFYNGKLKCQLWEYFSSEGIVLKRENYTNGKLSGELRLYNIKGILNELSSWSDGTMQGRRVIYFPNGNKEVDCQYKQNKLDGEYSSYFENGQIHSQGNYTQGVKNGVWLYYPKPDGQNNQEVTYLNGMISSGNEQRPGLQEELDSLERLNLRDPEKYINDPASYISKEK